MLSTHALPLSGCPLSVGTVSNTFTRTQTSLSGPDHSVPLVLMQWLHCHLILYFFKFLLMVSLIHYFRSVASIYLFFSCFQAQHTVVSSSKA